MTDTPTPTERPAGNVTFWLLFFASIATWPVLYLPVLGGGAGLGGVAFMALLWWPGLVLVNLIILCVVVIVFCRFRPRQIGGYLGAALAALHAAFFVAISLPYLLHFR